jgi:hypothetical protein
MQIIMEFIVITTRVIQWILYSHFSQILITANSFLKIVTLLSSS